MMEQWAMALQMMGKLFGMQGKLQEFCQHQWRKKNHVELCKIEDCGVRGIGQVAEWLNFKILW
jgi:hypothetical protein